VGHHRLFVESLRLSRLNRECALRTLANTGPQAVTVTILDDHGLAVSNLDSALGTGDDAVAATVALFLIYPDNVSHCHIGPPLVLDLTIIG
jgi:hypothetical protein